MLTETIKIELPAGLATDIFWHWVLDGEIVSSFYAALENSKGPRLDLMFDREARTLTFTKPESKP